MVFWQMGCDACENVLALLEGVHTSDELITVLGINVQDDEDVLREFVQERGYPFPVLFDRDGYVFEDYQLNFQSGPMINGNMERIRIILLDQLEMIPLVV